MEHVIEATGFEGLRGHHFEVAERFTSEAAHITFIRLDGAEPSVSSEQMKANIRVAEAVVAERQTHTVPLVFGPDQAPMDVTFTVEPGHLDQYEPLDSRYVIFAGAGQDLLELAAPVVAFSDCFTTNNAYGIDVAIIKALPGENRDAVPADLFCSSVEGVQLAGYYQLGYDFERRFDQKETNNDYLVTGAFPSGTLESNKNSLRHLLQETFANSYGFAMAATQDAWTYDQYRLTAQEIPFRIGYGTPSPTGASYRPFVLDEGEYQALRITIAS